MAKRKRQPRLAQPDDGIPVEVAKAITAEDLDAAGLKYPAKPRRDSAIMPEEEKDRVRLPRVEDYSGEENLPKDGLIISPAWMAEAVLTGKKKLVVKTHPFEIEGKDFLLISERKALGTIRLGKMEELDSEAFRNRGSEHLITEQLREDWAAVQASWGDGPFHAWPVEKATAFDEPRETDIGAGPQVVARDVVVKRIETRADQIFICTRLPAELAKKLTDLAGEIAKANDSEPETVDHITLLWIPSDGDISKEDALKASKAARDSVKGLGTLDANLQGWAYFDSARKDGKDHTALVALVDAPGLAELHVALKAALVDAGYPADKQTHGFVPHTTVAYLPKGARVDDLPVLGDEFEIKRVEFVHSDVKHLTLKASETEKIRPGKVSDEVIKRVGLAPDMDVAGMTTAELREIHWRLHLLYRAETTEREKTGFSIEDISNLHALAVDELYERDVKHPPPPGDGLDDVSEDFERHEEEQPDWEKPPWERVAKRDYAYINSSGIKRGESIKLGDVLQHFKTFKTRQPYIYLVGGLANRGETEGDIDILVKDTEDLPEAFKHVVHFRLGRALPPELAKRLEIHYDNFHGPFTSNVPLYDLTFERINPENEVKLMRDGYVEKRVLQPFGSPGGKNEWAAELLKRVPDHEVYVEPYAGGAALFWAKECSKKEILCDLDNEIIDTYKFLQTASDKDFEWLHEQEWERSSKLFNSLKAAKGGSLRERAYRFKYLVLHSVRSGRDVLAQDPPSKGQKFLSNLEHFRTRLQGVELIAGDAVDTIEKYDGAGTFFYIDPPWKAVARSEEWKNFDPKTLEGAIKMLKGKALVSYQGTLELPQGWQSSKVSRPGGFTQHKTAQSLHSNYEVKKQEARATSPEFRRQAECAVEKQADPYMEYPNEDQAPYRYTVQHHHRGKSLHTDLRIGFKPKRLLYGWTMNTQIAGSIKEPVTTLAEARRLARTQMDKISKINWSTGEWAERPKAGTTKLVRTSILSERKAPEPWAWLDVEGKTKNPEPGKPPPVGGTRNHPGVFAIVDEGDVEIGSNKPWFHEYFFTKGALRCRLIFRQLRITPAKKGDTSKKRCMYDGCKAAPEVDVLWADGRGRAWFCKEHLAAWKKKFKDDEKEDWLDIVGEKAITTGEVPEKWADVHKSEDVIVSKEIVLPPSEEQGLPGPAWLAIKPDDLTPYVLDVDAVKKDWMPPVGISALPRAIRKQIPEPYHYWTKRTVAEAKKTRDALIEAVKAKEVELDFAAPYKRTKAEKASMLDASFVLQEQTWRGPIQIRVGPSRSLWHLRLDVGRPELITVEMYLNPIDNKELAVAVKDDPHKESMKLEGPIKPSHYLNPTKATPSNIEKLDAGKASVLAYSDKFLKVQLKGELINGLFEANRSDGDWLWQPSESGPTVEKKGEPATNDGEIRAQVSYTAPIAKVDTEKRLVTGIVLEPNTVDAQGDTIDEEAIERAAHKFLARYNHATQMGLLHQIFGENGIDLVESWIAPVDLKLGDQEVKKGSWLMTVKVLEDALWKKIKSGDITGFSIGGIATVI